MFDRRPYLAILLVTMALSGIQAQDAWDVWRERNDASTQIVDHSRWDAFLSAYVVTNHPEGVHLVRYGAVTDTDHRSLAGYISDLESVRVSELQGDEQRAYWINLYNALTIRVILDNFPVDSIREINPSGGLFIRGPWKAKLLVIEGREVSLDDIEHRILRPIWSDPRIHYAVNCASIGCPNLQPVAFTSANTESLLNAGAVAYVNHPRGASVSGSRLTASSIYDWFQEDFGGNSQGVIDHLAKYADADLLAELERVTGRIRYDYDWSINEAP